MIYTRVIFYDQFVMMFILTLVVCFARDHGGGGTWNTMTSQSIVTDRSTSDANNKHPFGIYNGATLRVIRVVKRVK